MILLMLKKIADFLFNKIGLLWKVPLLFLLFEFIVFVPNPEMNSIKQNIFVSVWQFLGVSFEHMRENPFLEQCFATFVSFFAIRNPDFFQSMNDMQSLGDTSIQQLFNPMYASFFAEICLGVLVILFVFFLDRYSTQTIGITMNLKAIFLFVGGTIFASLFISLIFVILLGTQSIIILGYYDDIDRFVGESLTNTLFFDAIFLFFVAFQEELLCRAYFMNQLSWLKPFLRITIPAVIFSLIHFYFSSEILQSDPTIGKIAILNLFLLGMIYGYYYYKKKNLWLIIGAHFGWNFTMGSILGLNISGDQSIGVLVTIPLEGQELLHGGSFGPEGGLIVTGSLIVLGSIMVFLLRRKKQPVSMSLDNKIAA